MKELRNNFYQYQNAFQYICSNYSQKFTAQLKEEALTSKTVFTLNFKRTRTRKNCNLSREKPPKTIKVLEMKGPFTSKNQ